MSLSMMSEQDRDSALLAHAILSAENPFVRISQTTHATETVFSLAPLFDVDPTSSGSGIDLFAFAELVAEVLRLFEDFEMKFDFANIESLREADEIVYWFSGKWTVSRWQLRS